MAIPSSEDAPPLLEPLGSEVASGPKPYEILLEIANSLLLQQDLAKLVQSVFVRLRESGKFDALSLILHDSVSNVMRLRVSRAPSFTAVEPSETPVGDSPAGWVWQNQKPLLLRDLGAETAFSSYVHTLRENGIRSYYVLPVATAERSYGAVCFGSLQANAYSDSDLRFMEQLSTHITVAVDGS
jgi:GAF domain-containing protein